MLLSSICYNSEAKLIDKTIAIVNSDIFTLSEAKRTLDNYKARKNISPQLYENENPNIADSVENFIRSQLIRKNLEKIGFIISPAQVEDQINQTQKNLQVNREELLKFLSSNDLNYEEYFQITKETIEFNIFLARIIKPLIKITDFELKNKFSNNTNLSHDTQSFHLVDFYLDKKLITNSTLKNLREDLINFQKDGSLPEHLKTIETNVLNDIKEDGLSNEIKNALKGKNVNDFSEPILIGNQYHLFFIKKKKIVESEKFANAKMQLEQELFIQKSKEVITKWIKQEKEKYFIKTYL